MLKKTFLKLISNYSEDSNLAEKMWQEIEKKYSEKNRFYHNLNHLESLLIQLKSIQNKITNWESLLFTMFYHDIVYNVINFDNEFESAEFVEVKMKHINVPLNLISLCKKQIISTKSHIDTNDNDTNYFIDADLSILGQNSNTYLEYKKNVRKEYLFYPSVIYNEGRKEALFRFLNMDRIFKTDYFYEKFEKQARKNMLNEIEQLNGIVNLYFNKNTSQWVFNLEEDGDNFEFFINGAEILDKTKGVEKIKYYPGFFDSGNYVFKYKNVLLNFEYEGMLGIELRTETNPSNNDLEIAKEIIEILKTVRNKNYC